MRGMGSRHGLKPGFQCLLKDLDIQSHRMEWQEAQGCSLDTPD